MDIKAQALFQEMQSMARLAQADVVQNQSAIQPPQSNSSAQNFADMLGNALNNVNSMQLEAKNQAIAFEMGDKSLNLADVMVAKEKSGIAFEATVQVRNKVLEAYKQIMNMPV